MAKFQTTGSEGGARTDGKTALGKTAPKAGMPASEPATTVRLIRLAKPANDNPTPFAARLRWWAPLLLLIAAWAIWELMR